MSQFFVLLKFCGGHDPSYNFCHRLESMFLPQAATSQASGEKAALGLGPAPGLSVSLRMQIPIPGLMRRGISNPSLTDHCSWDPTLWKIWSLQDILIWEPKITIFWACWFICLSIWHSLKREGNMASGNWKKISNINLYMLMESNSLSVYPEKDMGK